MFGDKPVQPYLALGVGYRYVDGKPLGIVVLSYPGADMAQADLAVRRQLANEGVSLVTNQPYRETIFTLADATVTGSSIVLSVRPVDDRPRRLFDMVNRQDMAFAVCP